MKVIEVKEFDVPAGSEWNASSYPGPGAYLIRRSNSLYIVGTDYCVTGLLNGATGLVKDTGTGSTAGGSTLSESFFLKALAVAQQPALAQQLAEPK